MKKLRYMILAAAMLAAVTIKAQTGKETRKKNTWSTEEIAVLTPLQNLLDGLEKKDGAMMRNQLLPGFHATLVRDNNILQLDTDQFMARLPLNGPDKLSEPIYDPKIFIDGDIAMIWAPYKFFLNGVLHHWGTDIAHLVRKDGKWLIAYLGDNAKTQ